MIGWWLSCDIFIKLGLFVFLKSRVGIGKENAALAGLRLES